VRLWCPGAAAGRTRYPEQVRWWATLAAVATLAAACAEGGGRGPRLERGEDSGMARVDGGGADDSGAPSVDGGAPGTDAGIGVDAGLPGTDAGPPETDAGPACASAGCHAMATCDDSSGSPVCTCNAGWAGDGYTCSDVDECGTGTDDCHASATCTNTPGSFTCECSSGYSGGGRTCTDIDECTAGTAGCDANATCSNTPGSFTCTCDTGYTGDGFTCTAVGPVCTTLEGFEAGTWPVSPWVSAGSGGGTVSGAAAHDGSYGITDPDWYYETATTLGSTGDLLRAWVRGGTGRSYVGFAASASGCKSFVVAQNTGDIRFQENAGFGYSELSSSSTSIASGTWYLMEVEFLGGGSVVGRLYASDGTTLINSVTHSYGSIPVGGVCIRSFSGFAIDTIQICR